MCVRMLQLEFGFTGISVLLKMIEMLLYTSQAIVCSAKYILNWPPSKPKGKEFQKYI